MLEFFVLDNPKSASFAFRYPSSYFSSGAPVRVFTKTFKDLRSRCATRLLCKYFNPRATWSIISLKFAENSDTSKLFSSQVSPYFFLHKLLSRVLPMIYSCQTGVSLKRNRFSLEDWSEVYGLTLSISCCSGAGILQAVGNQQLNAGRLTGLDARSLNLV